MAETFANNAVGNLNANITNVATSLVLQAGQGAAFPTTGNFRILIGTEIIIVGARSGDTLSSLTRGAESTANVAHNAGDVVTHELTAGALNAAILQPAIVDAKGDLIAATAADTVARHAVGANDTVLTADSAQTTGLRWDGAWAAYTPTWTASAGTPAIGNGTLVGRYAKIGKTVFVTIELTAGSTTTFGTAGNQWIFSLPVTARALVCGGSVYVEDLGVAPYTASPRLTTTTTVVLDQTAPTPSVAVGATTPFTFATADLVRLFATYEAA